MTSVERGSSSEHPFHWLVGDLFGQHAVQKLLNISQYELARRVEEKKLLTLTCEEGQPTFPKNQFTYNEETKEWSLLDGLPEVLEKFNPENVTHGVLVGVAYMQRPELGDRSIIQYLTEETDRARPLKVAREASSYFNKKAIKQIPKR